MFTWLSKPDAVFIFDGGLSFPGRTFAEDGEQQDWKKALLKLAMLQVPVICTAYNKSEAEADGAYLASLGIRITRPPADNPFKSCFMEMPSQVFADHVRLMGSTDMEAYLAWKWRLSGSANQLFEFCGMK